MASLAVAVSHVPRTSFGAFPVESHRNRQRKAASSPKVSVTSDPFKPHQRNDINKVKHPRALQDEIMWRSPSNGVLCVPTAIFLCQSHTDAAPWGFVLRADKTPNIYPGTLRDQIQDARPKYHAGPRRSKNEVKGVSVNCF